MVIACAESWEDIRTLLAVETIRSINGTGKTEVRIPGEIGRRFRNEVGH